MKSKIIFLIITVCCFFFSCVNDTYDTPTFECSSPNLTKTKEVSEIYSLAINPTIQTGSSIPETPIYNADDVIEAYVISSDEGGNFYKSMYLQPTDGSPGFNFSVDESNLYTLHFQPGKKVFLKLKGLAFANPTKLGRGLIFGAVPTDEYAVDRLTNYKNHLIPSCDVIGEDQIVKYLTLAEALNDNHLNTLVEIEDVQFKNDCSLYSSPDYDTSLKITNGIQSLDMRTSRYANFAPYTVPSGRGSIRGVLCKYNSTYQLIIRTARDVKLNQPRIETLLPIKGGTTIQYLGAFTETFESYAATTTGAVLPKYINEVSVGYKYWDVASYSSNKYLQMSAYNSGCSKSYFVIPVDMTVASRFSFQSKDGYNNGNPLRVYYSMDYVSSSTISQATLVDITSKFKISTGNTDSYGSDFIDSGIFSIPENLNGTGYFIFEYDGSSGISTTIQMDTIKVE